MAAEFFSAEAPVTVEAPQGTPPAAIVRDSEGRVAGYAFSTREVAGSVGYSGRPLDIVAAVTPQGIIAGARIVAHEEPILVIGIPREALAAYVANFRGYDVRAAAALRQVGRLGNGPQAVAGATVTSTVIRDAILRSARAVLRTRSAEASEKPRLDRETLRRLSWPALAAEGALRRLHVNRGEAARLLGVNDDEQEKTFIELWLALATPPAIGESLLGQRLYESELAKLGPEDNVVVIAASGLYSFKGTEWRRSGVFDRIGIVQGEKTIRLRAQDHMQVERLQAPGTPELREIGLFRIAADSGFDPTAAFRLDLALHPVVPPPAPVAPAIASLEYRIPDRYIVSAAGPAAARDEGAAQTLAATPVQPPLWQDIWWARRFEIAGLAVMLVGLAGILIFQRAIVARVRFYYRLRLAYLLLTFIFLGLIANAQLSVVNVLTFFHALLSGFRWELFLLDPMVFLLWGFVAVSMLFWARGVFCGWLCPFGALQELVNALARRLGIRQVEVPFDLHERLWMIKYVIFLVILAVSLNSIMAAFGLAEIEPFKTAITMKFMRDWQFVAYAAALLATGVFIERFFCRYLCPLGAALAIPARMRMFDWLKRYRECGNECHMCARRCTVQAIHPLGQISPNECIYCLKCQANYFDPNVCIHLKKRIERRRVRAEPAVVAASREGGANAP
ncbi:MAG: 4Fe-4S binding protein [Bradyrhizobiaceae bacterium]|nr:4Fe-4S binding protein [Bradyrhizobiaceae bacterium]